MKRIRNFFIALFMIVASIGVNTPIVKAAPGDLGFINPMPLNFNLGNHEYEDDLEIEFAGFTLPQIHNDTGDESWTLSLQFVTSADLSLELSSIIPYQMGGPISSLPTISSPVVVESNSSVVVAQASAGQAIGDWGFMSPIKIVFDDEAVNIVGSNNIHVVWTLASSSGETSTTSASITFNVTQAPFLGTVTAYYLDINGGVIADSVTTNYETGDPYTTVQKNIDGYTFKEMEAYSAPASGYFGYSSLEVIYIYDVATYTATFNSNGGTSITTQTGLEFGDYITLPSEPTKSGFEFKGWFTDDITFADEWDFDQDTISEDVTLFAKWEATTPVQTYTATFNSNGGSVIAPQTGLESGDYITLPAEPSKSGHEFKGWFTDDITFANEWDFDANTITGDITLFAKWEATTPVQTYTATFNSNSGSPVSPQSNLSLGDFITKPTNPTKTGYDFKGWYTDDSTFNNAWDFSSQTITGNITLHAKWELSNPTIEEKFPSIKPEIIVPSTKAPTTDNKVTSAPSTGDSALTTGYIIALFGSIVVIVSVLKLIKSSKD